MRDVGSGRLLARKCDDDRAKPEWWEQIAPLVQKLFKN